MNANAVLVAAIIVAVAFAGCSGKGGDGNGDSGTTSQSSTTSSSNTTTSTHENRAPTANLTASPVNGSAPLNVTFNVTAEDPDGDDLTWTITFGDNATANGTGSPGNATHRYNATGNYTATLTVFDGKGLNGTANVTIVLNGSGNASGPPLTLAFATDGPCTHCYFAETTTVCADFRAGQGRGTTCDWSALPESAAGKPFLLTGGSDPGLEFFATCSAAAASRGMQDVTSDKEEGTVPAGAGCVVVYEFEELDNVFTLVIG